METVASFDIGKKNFSFYVEEFDSSKIPKAIKSEKYNIDGTPTKTMENYLAKIYKNGNKLLLLNNDLTENCDKKAYLDQETFYNMTDLLDKYKELWDKCTVFVIEQQMSFGKQNNKMAVKLGQHCASYFYIKYGRTKKVVEFPAYHKTQVLGSQKIKKTTKAGKVSWKNIDKPARKKWCIAKALEILKERDDEETSTIISKSKKKDDLSDVICQLQAYKILNY
jgi:uncharacterized protein YoxC